MTMSEPDRGTVTIKPVYIGIDHYSDVYGSVCSPDVEGTPPKSAPAAEDIQSSARSMVKSFQDNVNLEFVELQDPYIIQHHRDGLCYKPHYLTVSSVVLGQAK